MVSSLSVSGIYAIIHISGHRWYIGQSQNIGLRWAVHRANLRKGNHHCQYLQRAWNKYGSKDFNWAMVELCKIEMLDEMEQWWMDMTPDLFNVHTVAGSSRGYKISEETRRKISEAAKRRADRPEEKRIRSARAKAQHASKSLGSHTWTEEGRERVRKASREGPGICKAQEAAKSGQTSEEMSRRAKLRKSTSAPSKGTDA